MQKKDKRKRPDRRIKPRRRSFLVDNWRQAHKFASVQIVALIAASQGLIVFVPTLKDFIPDSLWHSIMGGLAICAILARVKNQAPKEAK